jgi:VanZ family protein
VTRGRGVRVGCAAMLVLWCAASWTLSSKSDPEAFVGVRLHLPDKVEHLIEYAAGGFLAAGAFGRSLRLRPWIAGVLFGVLWGISDEFHQSFVPGRDSSVWDLAADAVGAALGSLAACALFFRAQPASRGVDES